ncbi:hypothetical protein [Actinomycetospora aeridis]|uniref:Secreted protein n=1 Tax=Actinomycetospora aeridis TaxID=3129231 RepID=A0ABU8MZT4_9PSEU
MFKKMGVVTVGVAAGLMVAAPFASASECHEESDHETTSVSSDDDCNVTSGESSAASEIGDSKLGNIVTQVPITGNLGNVTCSEILSNNLSGNHFLNDVHVEVL